LTHKDAKVKYLNE